MEEGRTYKKYNCHIIIYKDLLNQKKQRQQNSHIWAYNNKLNCEKRNVAIKEYERKREIRDRDLNILKEWINRLPCY
jgi:hypothetical protein